MINRRSALTVLGSAGFGTAVFRRALAAKAGDGPFTPQMIADAEWIAGITLTPAQREAAVKSLNEYREPMTRVRAIELDNSQQPVLQFKPLTTPASQPDPRGYQVVPASKSAEVVARPATDEDLAFSSVRNLGALLRSREISSVELTKLYLDRLRRYDPLLKCVVTLMDELAIKQAKQADRELAEKKDRGPLHGIPWGVKDVVAYPGYPTTWGAPQYRHRKIDVKAAVAERLENAGAVLIAKLATNPFAGGGEPWFRGLTRCPWNPRFGRRRIVIGLRVGHGRRSRRFFHRDRHRRQHHWPLEALRDSGDPTNFRTREPTRLHATLLVARHDRTDLPHCRRLRFVAFRDSRIRSARPDLRRSPLRLALVTRSVHDPGRICTS